MKLNRVFKTTLYTVLFSILSFGAGFLARDLYPQWPLELLVIASFFILIGTTHCWLFPNALIYQLEAKIYTVILLLSGLTYMWIESPESDFQSRVLVWAIMGFTTIFTVHFITTRKLDQNK